MSTTPQCDWRAEAMRRMEEADQPVPQPARKDNWAAAVTLKLGLLIVLTVGLVWFLGWGVIFATAAVGWYLFWPR